MSLKRENLLHILRDKYALSIDRLPVLSWPILRKHPLLEEATEIYQHLGGENPTPPCFPPAWHIELEGNLAIQLDEQLHFNKYRSITLRSGIYQDAPPFTLIKYQNYCRKQANECLKSGLAGAKWTSAETEKQFGKAEAPGDLTGNGSPAWKMRAFGDFLQDLTPKLLPIRLIRLSIYDEIMVERKLVRLNEVLTLPTEATAEILLKNIERKIDQPPQEPLA